MIIYLLHLGSCKELRRETSRISMEVRRGLNENPKRSDKLPQKIKEEPERIELRQKEDYLIGDPYEALRTEIEKYYGVKKTKDSTDEETKSPEISHLQIEKKDKDYIHSCITGSFNDNSGKSWKGQIISKFINFGSLSIKYITDPWSPFNENTYINQLSKNLTN